MSTDAKRDLRRQMRALRRSLPDADQRSQRIWASVTALESVRSAQVVMAFSSVPGEPDTAELIEWCRLRHKRVVLPEDDRMPDPSTIDVVIVPGTAFTSRGERLGQGGGWYDRFLPRLGDDCVTIGVCFAPQIIDVLPVEPHDVKLDLVVTESSVYQG